jgi:hypothetical protein
VFRINAGVLGLKKLDVGFVIEKKRYWILDSG